MTELSFIKKDGEIVGFGASGHSEYAKAGGDIVCAAITSAVRYTECIINDVLACNAQVVVRGDTADIEMLLTDDIPLGKLETCRAVMNGLLLYMKQLQSEFPNNIKVLEV